MNRWRFFDFVEIIWIEWSTETVLDIWIDQRRFKPKTAEIFCTKFYQKQSMSSIEKVAELGLVR